MRSTTPPQVKTTGRESRTTWSSCLFRFRLMLRICVAACREPTGLFGARCSREDWSRVGGVAGVVAHGNFRSGGIPASGFLLCPLLRGRHPHEVFPHVAYLASSPLTGV